MTQSPVEQLRGEKVDEILTKSFNEGVRQARLLVQGKYNGGVENILRALSTGGSATGAEFLPTGFSPELVAQFRQALVVSPLFRHVKMPTKTYELPVAGAPATSYLVAENTGDSSQTAITASTPGTAKVTFSAKDIGAMTFVSNDEEQDSIVPMIPFIQESLIRGLAEGIENALINGDTTATHQDTDTEALGATAVATAWKGLRKHAIANSYKTDLSTFNVTTMRGMRKSMGKYGVDPSRLAWIVSNSAYNQMLSFAEVSTVDKFSSAATIVNGRLEMFDGIPVFVSPYMREDLDATGVNGASGNTKTAVLLVNRDGFLIGDRQEIRLAQEASPIEYRQMKVIADMRLDFQPTYAIASNPVVWYGYNITA